jgi:hypothetical protein
MARFSSSQSRMVCFVFWWNWQVSSSVQRESSSRKEDLLGASTMKTSPHNLRDLVATSDAKAVEASSTLSPLKSWTI